MQTLQIQIRRIKQLNDASPQPNTESTDSSKKDEINAQIESKSATITTNNSTIKQAKASENSTKKEHR